MAGTLHDIVAGVDETVAGGGIAVELCVLVMVIATVHV